MPSTTGPIPCSDSKSDDTSVALLHKTSADQCQLHFHEKVTANNSPHGGVHPIVSLESHHENLALLIAKALRQFPLHDSHHSVKQKISPVLKPDFISVTRGPGMRSSLTTGLDTAKGLAVACQIPLVGINHMQAHALTPRLVSMLDKEAPAPKPDFPFLSLLVSGGHTLLVHSKAITNHKILAETTDIAIGDAIDKIARHVLPPTLLKSKNEIMYGRLLENFVFPNGASSSIDYVAPTTRAEEIVRRQTQWGWALCPPLAETRSGEKSKAMEFTFSGLESAVRRICDAKGSEMSIEERIDLGKESMRIAFEHLASRVGWALHDLKSTNQPIDTLVVSGGVASNTFLKIVLRSFLAARGFHNVNLVFPPAALCTDNAAMIAWAGMEMFERGWESELSCRALRKWSIDASAEDGGILGADCWKRRYYSGRNETK
ncbi:Mitochondrial tRNAs modification protein [Lecanora helva]